MNNESKPIGLEALSQLLDLDIAADAKRTQKEVDDELKRRGLNPVELNRNAVEALRNALSTEKTPAAASKAKGTNILTAVSTAGARLAESVRRGAACVRHSESSSSFKLGEFLFNCGLALEAPMGSSPEPNAQRAEATFDFPSLRQFGNIKALITINVIRRGNTANVTFLLHSNDSVRAGSQTPIELRWVRIGKKDRRTELKIQFGRDQTRVEQRITDVKDSEEWEFSTN